MVAIRSHAATIKVDGIVVDFFPFRGREAVVAKLPVVDWARSWTRGAVLKHAIQMIKPAPEHTDCVSFITLKRSATPTENNPFAAILLLDAFERFVFVMSILEEQSDEECAILLRCSRRDVMMARLLALKRQSGTDTLAEEILQS